MKTKIIKATDAQKDIDRLCQKAKLSRKLRPLSYANLRPYGTQILAWARSKKSSKRKVAALIQEQFQLRVSPDKVYRFVKAINQGNWPNAKKGSDSND